MKRLFTLIELIIVIVVLGILATIVIPNISNIQDNAKQTALVSNNLSVQLAVDMYTLNNSGKLPVQDNLTNGSGHVLDLNKLYPDMLRDIPNEYEVKYWVDDTGKVWSSKADTPINISNSVGTLSWDPVYNAKGYNVYEVVSSENAGTSMKETMRFIDYTEESTYPDLDPFTKYAVSSIDKYGFESLPAGGDYEGYPKSFLTDGYATFNGENDYAMVGNYDIYNFEEGEFTVEAWVKPSGLDTHSSLGDPIISKEGSYRGYQMTWDGKEKRFGFMLEDMNMIWSNSNKSLDRWYYVSIVYNNGVGNMYVNGNLEGSLEYNYTPAEQRPLMFAGFATGQHDSRHFEGEIAEVRIWNLARPESDIKGSMNKELTGSEEGLVGLWKLNKPEDRIVEDLSLYGKDAVLSGSSFDN